MDEQDDIIGEETRKQLWIPNIIFSNTKHNDIIENDEKTTINIIKRSNYSLNSKREVNEAAIYKGKDNIIKYTREYDKEILCAYDLRLYPFDEQICTIDAEITTLTKFIKLIPTNTGNLGVADLIQFVIMKTDIIANKNNSLVQCKIYLKRIPWSHIASVYIPCSCVLFMCLITLFIDKSHFDATIMVSLTSMLVMYTLYQSIAGSMPKTAYLKLLDYWLLYGMILPFIVFSVEVIWQLMDQNHTQNRISVQKPHQRPSEKSALHHARCILPVVTITFVTIYVMVALVVYFDGQKFIS